MLLTGLFGFRAAGAAAEVMIPTIVLPDTSTQFVANPVVQPLPQVGTGTDPEAKLAAARQAGTLGALVDAQPTEGDLSPEMRCLAGAIYFEARGETLEGQLAVGRVVVNRSKSGRFPASYCGVVYQPSQFSFVRGRSMPAVRTGSQDWREAVAVARIADQNAWNSEAPEALFFHAARVSPSWRLTRLARVDNHIFYR
ncbi:spore germination cell wall hydrolase CwlJ-like protein [Novosphingobium chloroacetimidivorans]|uniref:Spore germination cell wall hydrolase CwlJ-like protein n=1 Tax=Novosphingobium chloroacetimidivorans TaxID=1428314 RepID=A0A7W7K953_9SPHN|nr:cell wall hydrolase [Novosphingobium chloroacetimidivorans]MBB4857848.1 spore germination cell wall hydrolase CwlJ-like protein [Novosphingobium chloroacetimidivorans]